MDRGVSTTIGPLVKVNGKLCHWHDDVLMDPDFNKIAELVPVWPGRPGKPTYELRVFRYRDGFRYVETSQVLPLADSLGAAQRMVIPILSIMQEKNHDKHDQIT